MKSILALRVVLILIFLAFFSARPASAQEDYRRVSLTLNGGIAYASTNASGGGNQFSPRGFFGTSIEPSLSVGGGVMFGIHPSYSIELNGQYISFEFTDATRENRDLTYISFRNIVHMNQLVGFELFTPRLAPYVTALWGVNILDFDTNIGWHIAGGVGLSARLSNTVDFFAQYEMNMANGTTNP
ncbi:MAG: outer membrane beta-barrel protein, partial [Cyclonatronaceae bacterium]